MTAPSNATDPRLLRLSPEDNVLVLLAPVAAGESLRIDGHATPMKSALPLGHKIAARAIGAGEKILKYGAPIGAATRDIAAGDHVHTHNLRSDYLPGPLEH